MSTTECIKLRNGQESMGKKTAQCELPIAAPKWELKKLMAAVSPSAAWNVIKLLHTLKAISSTKALAYTFAAWSIAT